MDPCKDCTIALPSEKHKTRVYDDMMSFTMSSFHSSRRCSEMRTSYGCMYTQYGRVHDRRHDVIVVRNYSKIDDVNPKMYREKYLGLKIIRFTSMRKEWKKVQYVTDKWQIIKSRV